MRNGEFGVRTPTLIYQYLWRSLPTKSVSWQKKLSIFLYSRFSMDPLGFLLKQVHPFYKWNIGSSIYVWIHTLSICEKCLYLYFLSTYTLSSFSCRLVWIIPLNVRSKVEEKTIFEVRYFELFHMLGFCVYP